MAILLDAEKWHQLKAHGILIRDFVNIEGNITLKVTPFGLEPWTGHSHEGVLPLGAYSYCRSFFPGVSYIGRYCSMGLHIKSFNNSHPIDHVSSSPVFYRVRRFTETGGDRRLRGKLAEFHPDKSMIKIGHDVWIGDNVKIRVGTTIGDGAVIAHGSIVTKDVPDYMIVGGIPAKPIRKRFDEELCQRLKALAWWQYSSNDLVRFPTENPDRFATELERAVAKGELQPMEEKRFHLKHWLKS